MPLNSTRGAGSAKAFGFTAGGASLDVDYLVLAGGGGGGNSPGGGGGAGGLRTSFPGGTKLTIRDKITTITVGAGATGVPQDGGTATIANVGQDSSIGIFAASGGGAGRPGSNPFGPGGSGGGTPHQGGPTAGQGNKGGYTPSEGNPGGVSRASENQENYQGSGGGGAGGAGFSTTNQSQTSGPGGPGGAGVSNSITGSSVGRAGGGGGGMYNPGSGGNATDGGGLGMPTPGYAVADPGATGKGAGGGGSGYDPGSNINVNGGNGGSGTIIIRVPAATAPAALAVSPGTNTLTTLSPSGDKLCTFTVSGTLTI
jgi:hypothetical protein